MEDKRDPMDGDYIGNIFGWKISLIGLVVMLVLVALVAYRHWAMDVPLGFEDPLVDPFAIDTLTNANKPE